MILKMPNKTFLKITQYHSLFICSLHTTHNLTTLKKIFPSGVSTYPLSRLVFLMYLSETKSLHLQRVRSICELFCYWSSCYDSFSLVTFLTAIPSVLKMKNHELHCPFSMIISIDDNRWITLFRSDTSSFSDCADVYICHRSFHA